MSKSFLSVVGVALAAGMALLVPALQAQVGEDELRTAPRQGSDKTLLSPADPQNPEQPQLFELQFQNRPPLSQGQQSVREQLQKQRKGFNKEKQGIDQQIHLLEKQIYLLQLQKQMQLEQQLADRAKTVPQSTSSFGPQPTSNFGPAPARTIRWEYKKAALLSSDEELNELGDEGWELVGLSASERRFMIFKRPKQ